MSIVGASGVNLKDLEGLGVPTLTAMAQGQIKSVAPSYMVLAALKSLTDAQKGMMRPQQPTVKDQVVSQAVPAVQQGMGAAAPVAAFADGGRVQSQEESDREAILGGLGDFWYGTKRLGAAAADIGTLPARAAMGAVNSAIVRPLRAFGVSVPYIPDFRGGNFESLTPYSDALDEGEKAASKERRYPSTIPDEASRKTGKRPDAVLAPEATPSKSILGYDTLPATRASAGIASAGSSPISRYKPGRFEDKLEFTAKPEDYKLNIPKNQQLIDAYNRMSKPDEARMKEYADERRMSGLAALAQGIMQGRGLGQAIPQAAAGFVGATRGVDKERRAYEDARQRAAMELGIKMGDNERSDAIAGAEYGVKRAGVDDARAIAAHKAGLDVFTSNEAAAAKAEELRLSAERNRIAAEQVTATRGAARLTAATEALRKIQTDGERIAQKAADEYLEAVQKSPQYADPNVQRMAISEANRIRSQTFSKYTEANAASISRLQQVIQEQ